MPSNITLKGSLQIGGDACGSSCGNSSNNVRPLSLRCGSGLYETVIDTATPLVIQTQGLPGAAFVDLEVLGDLTAIEFLYAESTGPMVLRIGASEAQLTATGATYPTGFTGGETLNIVIDGTPVAVVFDVADQTLQQVVARINAACALATLATPRAAMSSPLGGQLVIFGTLTGAQGSVEVVSGTASADLGLTNGAVAVGGGDDVPINGLFIAQFPSYPNAAPARVQVSGQGRLSLVGAGRTNP